MQDKSPTLQDKNAEHGTLLPGSVETYTIRDQQKLNNLFGDEVNKSLTDEIVNVALTYIDDAVHLRSTDRCGVEIDVMMIRSTDFVAVRAHKLYTNKMFGNLVGLCVMTHLLLAYWEKPCVATCGDSYLMRGIETFIVFVYIAQLTLNYLSRGYQYFWKCWWNVGEFVVVMAMTVDMFGMWLGGDDWVHFSRIARIFMVMNFADHTRDQTMQILSTIVRMIPTVSSIYGFLCVAAIFAYALFSGRSSDPAYFGDFYTSWKDMYVCLTTSNFPDVMITAYTMDSTYAVFFIVFYVLGLYIGMNLVLGVVFTKYQDAGRNEMKQNAHDRRHALNMAFDILDINHNGCLSKDEWDKMYYALHPRATTEESKLVDKDGSGVIDRNEFFQLCDVAVLHFVKFDPKKNYFPRKPNLHAFLNHWIVESWMLVLLAINGALTVYSHNKPVASPLWPSIVDTIIILLYVVELCARMYARGAYQYLHANINLLDIAIIAVSLIGKFIMEFYFSLTGTNTDTVFTLITLFRAVRLLRVVTILRPLRELAVSVVGIVAYLFKYFGIIIIMFYAYAMVGMFWFEGVFVRENEKLIGTAYAGSNYYDLLHFNSFSGAAITLFVLMIGNNWSVLMEAAVTATNRYALLYFLAFNFTVAQVVLNIVVSFVIAALSFVRDNSSKDEPKYTMPGESHDEYNAENNFSYSLMEEMFGKDDKESADEYVSPVVTIATETQLKNEVNDQRRLISQLLQRVASLENSLTDSMRTLEPLKKAK